MNRSRFLTGVVAVAAIGLAGCDAEPGAEERPSVVANRGTELGPQVINQLKQEYPVLREEPAPPPRPSPEANPGENVPESLEGTALETVVSGATYYADTFEGRRTASGIPFRQNQLVAAHRTYPFGTILRVTNLRNDRSVNVRVVDRGPFAHQTTTVIDLSRRAANQLDFVSAGRAQVRVEVLEWGDGLAT